MMVYIVSYVNPDNAMDPIITVFDNRDAAESCCKYFKHQGYFVHFDIAPLYHEFKESV